MAAILVEAGRVEQAINAVNRIADLWDRAWVQAEVVGELIKARHIEQALEIAIGIKDPWMQARALVTVVRSGESGGDGEITYKTICELLLSPYARDHIDVIPFAMIERLLIEGHQI